MSLKPKGDTRTVDLDYKSTGYSGSQNKEIETICPRKLKIERRKERSKTESKGTTNILECKTWNSTQGRLRRNTYEVKEESKKEQPHRFQHIRDFKDSMPS